MIGYKLTKLVPELNQVLIIPHGLKSVVPEDRTTFFMDHANNKIDLPNEVLIHLLL